jgi:N-acylglucosamine 2-epimerase
MNNQQTLQSYAQLYKQNLFDDVLPFWTKNSIDKEYDGFFTSLDRQGNVFDTDKFSWLQGRQIWLFSMLYNRVENKQEWVDIATYGVDFLKKHGREAAENNSFYFSWNRVGQPLVHAYNIFSDCFAALGFNEYAKATGDKAAKTIALQSYQRFIARLEHPKGIYEKTVGNRPLSSFGLPMMTAFLTSELENLIGQSKAIPLYKQCIELILKRHRHPETGLIHEFVGVDGQFLDTYNGRLLNPGHGIEAMWFLMDIGVKLNDKALIEEATDICLHLLNHAWDKEYGGIFYFLDAKTAPPQQLEWDQKLWWVHLEALIALSKAYLLTERADVWKWYEKVHAYTWSHFPDPEYGEWFGYLNRQGQVLLSLKGGKWKGCFHVPRALFECWQNFEKILEKQNYD